MLICLFCFTLFLDSGYEDDICPECEIGHLATYEKYLEMREELGSEYDET